MSYGIDHKKASRHDSPFLLPWKDPELYTAINEFECDYQWKSAYYNYFEC